MASLDALGDEGLWLAGAALLLLGWSLTRRAAAARWRLTPTLLLDCAPPLTLFATSLALSARPLLAGLITLAAGAGWARADADKRRVLREPIIFTDLFQIADILRHPQLALPFPHKAPIVLAAALVLAGFTTVCWLEPPQWRGRTALVVPVFLGCLATVLLVLRLLPTAQALGLTADPARDAALHGPFAAILLHASFARRERAARRTAAARHIPAPPLAAGPVVLVQSESFFDVRRLDTRLATRLPHFAAACREAMQWGRLAVPSWGANTVRTEFAVLSGLGVEALGFDRFNPYLRFARAPISALAAQFRAQGYRTVCLHPFDRRFYGRDQVMPQLGFDAFLGEEQFADAERVDGYIADIAVARVAERLLAEHGPKLFLFIVTIENHGPWHTADDVIAADVAQLDLDARAQKALQHYLDSLEHADAMLGRLRAALARLATPAVLGFYGDHLPSLPDVFTRLNLTDAHSDYLLCHTTPGTGVQQDIAAEHLGAALLAACAGR